VQFRNVNGYLLAEGRKFQKLANIIKRQQSMNQYGALFELCLQRELKYLEKNLLQYHFVHHKSHMNWPGIEPSCVMRECYIMEELL